MKEDKDMATTYGKRKNKHTIILHTIITVVLLCAVFLTMVSYFYQSAEEEAFENLHMQTKQIKDDMHLQLISDRENLVTMASFAAKLYSDGESYDLMFKSFKPIGLIANIGILNPDNTFMTKAGTIDLDGRVSFEDEKEKGEYISGRLPDLIKDNHEIIRSAVPIKVGDDVVGIMYGVIRLDDIGERYNKMARELEAQLFVYDRETGNLVIDTVHSKLGNISFLKDRKYNKGYSYEQMAKNNKGFAAFESAYKNENLYLHYSSIDDIGWGISLGRYESQVFAETHKISRILFTVFLVMVIIMFFYMLNVMREEKREYQITTCASNIRKVLLEINQNKNNITAALKQICLFSNAHSVLFFDTDGEDYNYTDPVFEKNTLLKKDREYFTKELLRYSAKLYSINNAAINVMCIIPDGHLSETNPKFYEFLKKHGIFRALFATITDENNHVSILGAVNPVRSKSTSSLLADIAVCFSIALYNKNHLNRTELAATTDSLTGVLNRVAYKRDLLVFDEEKPQNFACIYIDVNELHLCNNRYGHAYGDEMLLYIANTLKEVFYGHRIYRMGGDEFLVFARNTDNEAVKKGIQLLIEQLEPVNYHVAIGMSYRTQNTNTDEMVREAEIRMYEAKAQYYQNKENRSISKSEDTGYVQMHTGIREIDTMLNILKEHYNGIYRVSLDTDKAYRILMPAYLGYSEDEEHYSKLLKKYIEDMVDPDFHRAVMNFLNYDAIKRQILEGNTPRITYKKANGETVILSIYKLSGDKDSYDDTLWVFAKD